MGVSTLGQIHLAMVSHNAVTNAVTRYTEEEYAVTRYAVYRISRGTRRLYSLNH